MKSLVTWVALVGIVPLLGTMSYCLLQLAKERRPPESLRKLSKLTRVALLTLAVGAAYRCVPKVDTNGVRGVSHEVNPSSGRINPVRSGDDGDSQLAANSNRVCDVDECWTRHEVFVRGHDNVVTNALAYGGFDQDKDNLPDWWELRNGLPPNGGVADEYADPDHDGLINLHEFMMDTNPLLPDGSNTLLSVMSRSVDDRLVGVDLTNGTSRFVNYFHNASNGVFVVNTNLWCRDVDLSCVSMWHQEHAEDSSETRGTRTATAVTRRHVVISNHWKSDHYRFCDTNGLVVSRSLDRVSLIYGDTLLGRLDSPLPESFVPAKLLPSDYHIRIGSGKYLPSLTVNELQQVVVGEIEDLDQKVNGLFHYGMVGSTNVVNEYRERIRDAISIGQSSSPVFLLLGDKPVLLMIKHLGYPDALQWNPTWGPSLQFHIDRIQQIIDSWEGIGLYQLNMVDLSEYQLIDASRTK